ncbi:hypothetical protein E5676_scaffold487G00360 [Cucumis melo var. makuwa]|uniref:Reverse transcriptase domain-containing protein n=1 Tax=Cucumis melo var. makuwa TaxID=1194695 RepID=A0A5D3BE08_CUCMM|nr:hypothetical protein E6C27_scaffold36G00390 [Cucumis melo var. makuwa]TYJ98012.1 hypothetical protein E5676_scaffold487G00360 [Cucumis melo var. makuwa]
MWIQMPKKKRRLSQPSKEFKNDEELLAVFKKENGIELKVLPSHLKYMFLGEKNTYPVIISMELTEEQEARLLETLKIHSQAIGWSLEDLKVVKKEVLKLKDANIIYPILYSTWVTPIHVVPKKTGMTIVKNNQGKCIEVFADDFTVYGNDFDSCSNIL